MLHRSLLLFSLLLITTGCTSLRTTTTARTALEQALLSQAAETSMQKLKFEKAGLRSYLIKKDYLAAVDAEYLMGTLNQRLLSLGLRAADADAEAELFVYPSVAHAGIDDYSFLIGLPSIPLSLPGVGGITIPEAALFKHTNQRASNRLFVTIKDAKTKQHVLTTETVNSEKYYDRWAVFFLFHWRTTDLLPPH